MKSGVENEPTELTQNAQMDVNILVIERYRSLTVTQLRRTEGVEINLHALDGGEWPVTHFHPFSLPR